MDASLGISLCTVLILGKYMNVLHIFKNELNKGQEEGTQTRANKTQHQTHLLLSLSSHPTSLTPPPNYTLPCEAGAKALQTPRLLCLLPLGGGHRSPARAGAAGLEEEERAPSFPFCVRAAIPSLVVSLHQPASLEAAGPSLSSSEMQLTG